MSFLALEEVWNSLKIKVLPSFITIKNYIFNHFPPKSISK
jgi:hypothetical protein